MSTWLAAALIGGPLLAAAIIVGIYRAAKRNRGKIVSEAKSWSDTKSWSETHDESNQKKKTGRTPQR